MKKFNHIVKSLLVLALIFVGVANTQGRWELVSSDKEDGLRYIDTETIMMLSPSRYLFWQKLYPSGSQRHKYMELLKLEGAPNADKFAYVMSRLEADCSGMKVRIHSIIYFTDDGNFISDTSTLSKWFDSTPESVGERVLKRVCTKGYDAKEM